jgi:hypothetical protein
MNFYLVLDTRLLRSSSRCKNVEHEFIATAQHYLASPPASPILWMEQWWGVDAVPANAKWESIIMGLSNTGGCGVGAIVGIDCSLKWSHYMYFFVRNATFLF